MNMHIKLLVVLFSMSLANTVSARINIVGSSDFKNKINHVLKDAQSSSPHLERLVNSAKQSLVSITIKAITNDRSTWHASGKKSRSHTEALDSRSRGAPRSVATDSVIYINVNRITATHKSYKSGTFIHELAHAVDLVKGNYHKDYMFREKRAVFFQNIWRNKHGKKLREMYHQRFKTREYQESRMKGTITNFVNYYFNYSGVL